MFRSNTWPRWPAGLERALAKAFVGADFPEP